VIDHLVAVLVLSALFVAGVVVVPNLAYVGLLGVDERQLRNVAEDVLKAILLDEGYPLNWGSSSYFDACSVRRFGLALSGADALYVLDSDKVERLVVGNPIGFVEYARSRELLGLKHYGFGIRIAAPFRVGVTALPSSGGYAFRYEVSVALNNGKPVPNAQITGLVVYSRYEGGSQEDERYSIQSVTVRGSTNELGKSVVECNIGSTYSDVIAIFKATVAKVATVVFYRLSPLPNNVATVNVVGDEVILTHPKVIPNPNENRWIENAALLTDEELVNIYVGSKNDTLNWGTANWRWSKSFRGLSSLDSALLIFDICAVEKSTGRKGVLVVGPYPNYLGDRVVQYGGVPQGATVELHAPVVVSGMTYIVTFTLWREA